MVTFPNSRAITNEEYNDLVARVNAVYSVGTGDSGYGATALGTVNDFGGVGGQPSALVSNEIWISLRDAISQMGIHQIGAEPTSLPELDTLDDFPPGRTNRVTQPPGSNDPSGGAGDLVQDSQNFDTAITEVTNNRLLVDPANLSTRVGENSIRSADWSQQIIHSVTYDFGNEDSARYFFNTGGRIEISASAPTNDAAHNWGALYNAAGTIVFDYNSYYNLSSTINVFTDVVPPFTSGTGVYSLYSQQGNQWVIRARYTAGGTVRGARGSAIEIRAISTDAYSGKTWTLPTGPITTEDRVVGTFSSTFSLQRAINTFERPMPTVQTVIPLTNGI